MTLRTLPEGLQTLAFVLPDGSPVGVIVDWSHIRYLAKRAASNKSRRATFGPVVVVLPKEGKK